MTATAAERPVAEPRAPSGRRLTIGMLTETGTVGGAERMFVQLAQELRARGHQIVPVVPRNERRGTWLFDTLATEGFAPETFILRSPYDLRLVWELRGTLRRRGADVLHSHEFFMAVCGGLCGALLRLPHVITMHGTHYYAERPLRVKALRWAARRSNGIVGVSAATARELSNVLGLGPDVVRQIDNGIRFEEADRSELRRELGIGAGELVIASVGRLSPEKGHAVLVRALGELARDAGTPAWRAVFAGGGPEEDRLRALAREAGLDGRLHLLGQRSDVAAIHAAADVFVLPSLSEGLPLALLEAMHAGAAIVASDVGGIPEAVTHGDTALLVPPDDPAALAAALRRLLLDPAERQRLGTAAERLVRERYDIRRMVDAYEALYVRRD